MNNAITHHGGGISIVGKDAVQLYAAAVLRSAIKLYLKTGMRANRMYTPANMLLVAGNHTGKPYKRGQLQLAFDDLGVWIEEQKASGAVQVQQEGEAS